MKNFLIGVMAVQVFMAILFQVLGQIDKAILTMIWVLWITYTIKNT